MDEALILGLVFRALNPQSFSEDLGFSCFPHCGSGSSCFLSTDPDPAALSMLIRIQL